MLRSARAAVFAAGGFLVVLNAAIAATSPAEQAGELLARVQAVDVKCSFLSAADREVLSSLVVRAELALAQREAVSATKAALQRGRDAAKNAQCNDAAKRTITTVLNAARQAAGESNSRVAVDKTATGSVALPASTAPQRTAPAAAVGAEKPKAETPPSAMAASPTTPRSPKQMKKDSADLSSYAALTERYYLARRCNSMSASQMSGLYGSIVSAHKRLMTSYGSNAVSAALRRGEANAGSRSCS